MDQQNQKDILKGKIKNIDDQITLLAELKQKCLNQISALETPPVAASEQTPLCNLTPDEKISLFMEYFRGHNDVFARWILIKRIGWMI